MIDLLGCHRKHNLGEMALCYLYILRTLTGFLKVLEIVSGQRYKSFKKSCENIVA